MQKIGIKLKKQKRIVRNTGTAILSVLLVIALAVGLFSGNTALAAEKVSDLDTSTKYTESLGDNASTEYAGRIWTDKSVYSDDAEFELFGGGTATVENDSDFLVAYSTLATSQAVQGQTQAPIDVVFIIDISGSMSNQDSGMENGKSRIYNTIQAVNSSIDELMELNEYTRVSVVAFSGNAEVLLPLDRYEKVSVTERVQVNGRWQNQTRTADYFEVSPTTASNSNSTLYTRAKGDESGNVTKTTSVSGGTNIQMGLYEGMNVLASEDSTTVMIDGNVVTRVPSVVLLSDGSPTFSSDSTKWWAPQDNYNDGPGSAAYAGNGMKAIMTGAYMKDAINRNYGVAGTASETTVYTVGMGITNLSVDEKNLAYMTLDPGTYWDDTSVSNSMKTAIKSYWNSYIANNNTGTVNINVGKWGNGYEDDWYRLTHPTTGYDVTSVKDYVDDYYDANSAADVVDVFDQIVSNISISTPQVPTELKGTDPISDGYITYTDPIGEYMEVKDVKEIIYAGTEFTQKSKTTSDDGLTTTYTFSGEVHSEIYGNQEIKNIIIQVTEDENGNQTLTVKIPASVIPVRVNTVMLNEDGSVKSHTNNGAYPARVLYTVGLKDELKDGDNIDTSKLSEEYLAANTNDDGTVNFYSNLYTGENVVNGSTAGNTTVEFEPSHTNSFYYMLDDIQLFSDKDCTVPVSADKELDDNTTYYYKETYYYRTNVVTELVERTGAQLKKTDLVEIDGYWYRAEGSPRVNRILEFEGTKSQNSTDTAEDFYAPTFEYAKDSTSAYDGKFVIYLGNNGVLKMNATGNLEITKNVVVSDGLDPDTDEFEFTVNFDGDEKLEGSYSYKVVDADGNVVTTGTVADGGTVKLKDGQTVKISGLPHDTTYEVTEKAAAGYTTTVDKKETNKADGTISAGKTSSEVFTNTYEVEPVTFPAEGGLSGTKVLEGRPADAELDSYSFLLTPYNNAPLPEGYDSETGVTVTLTDGNEADFDFGSIQFTEPGVYRYTIAEKEPDDNNYLPGMTYSRALYRVVITVTDNGDGTLSADADIQKLYEDDATPLFTYDDDRNIVLNEGQEEEDDIVFTNKYSVDDVERTPVAVKSYTDNSGQKPLTSGMFEFKFSAVGVVGSDGNVIADTVSQVPMPTDENGEKLTSVITENEGANVTFPSITFKHRDVPESGEITFRYMMEEIAGDVNGMTYDSNKYYIDVTVSVEADSHALLVNAVYPNEERVVKFVNEYTPTPVTVKLEGTKTLNGRDMLEGEEFEFSYGITDNDSVTSYALRKGYIKVDTNKMDAAVSGGTDGEAVAFDFGEMKITRPGTYLFYVREVVGDADGVTYDTVDKYVTIEVVDNDGVLEATVTYDNGNVSDADDKAVFVNEYKAEFDKETAVSLSGTKNLTGKTLLEGEFYFNIESVDPTNPDAKDVSVTHTADTTDENKDGVYTGDIQFLKDVTYTEAGEYVYLISEEIPDQTVGGTTYDKSIYRFTVNVEDDYENARLYVESTKLEVSTDGGKTWSLADAVEFNNSYKPEEKEIIVSPMTKVLSGDKELKAGDFEFKMSVVSADPEDGIKLPADTTVKNDADGKISFGNITFTKAGTYTIKVTEVLPDGLEADENGNYVKDGITYTTKEITATYEVTDDRNGNLIPVLVSSHGGRTFTNTYESEGELSLKVAKDFTGREDNKWLDTDKFEFEILVKDAATQAAIDANEVILPDNAAGIEITAADSVKEAAFDKIIINKAGEYKFIVREKTGSIEGVNYDPEPREVIVTATDNGDGTIKVEYSVADGKTLTFENIYDPGTTDISGHDNLKIEKTFTGRDNNEWLDTDKFVFTLAAGDDATQAAIVAGTVVMPAETLEVTNANKAYPHFGNITFKKAGTYTFTVTEEASNIAGVVDDKNPTRTIVVNVVDNGNGTLTASVDTEKSDSLEFTNTYKVEETKLTGSKDLVVTKVLSGRDWFEDDVFTFTLTAVGETEAAVEAGDVVLPDNASELKITKADNETANFGDIIFKKAGTYTFEIKENAGEIDGISYTSASVLVTVIVTDKDEDGNPTGKLTATASYDTEDGIKFTNTYTPDPVATELTGKKVLTGGRELKAGDFRFRINAVTKDAPLPSATTVVNGNGGEVNSITFGEITYTEAGTYEYEISEIHGNLEGVTYDSGKVKVTVKVTYNQENGKFETPEVTYKKVGGADGTGFTFTNTYKGEPADLVGYTNLKVTKNFTGRTNNKWIGTDKFEFELEAADDVTKAAVEAGDIIMSEDTTLTVTNTNKSDAYFGNITFKEEGTYKFKVTEKDLGADGITYDDSVKYITVNVTDGKNGKLVVTKSESSDALVFDNTYSAVGEITLEIKKELEGRDWFEGEAFAFTLAADGEDTVAAEKAGDVIIPTKEITISSADEDKKAGFEGITFKKPGTYSFVIEEKAGDSEGLSYDTHKVTVTVVVKDNDAGQLVAAAPTYSGSMTFTNVYTPAAVTEVLEGVKELEGRTLEAGEFTFNLEAITEDAPMPAITSVTNGVGDDVKKVSFGAITYTEAGTYEYKITEAAGDLGGVTYDEGTVKAIVTVTYDSKTGKLATSVAYEKTGGNAGEGFTFTNIYKAKETDPVEIKASKSVDPSDGNSFTMNGDDFQFEIEPSQNNPAGDPIKQGYKTNTADGNVLFANVQYEQPGTYVYTVHEVDENRAGISYDDSVYTITVVITDNTNTGKLEKDVTITKDGKAVDAITFNNGYDPAEATAVIHGHKNLTGKDLEAGEFSFSIKAVTDGAPMPAETTVKNEVTGLFQFGTITYTQPGTYEYEISENNGGKAGYTYDGKTYKVTVEVTDTDAEGVQTGELKATVTGVKDANNEPIIVFNNSYKPAKASVVIDGTKRLTGRDLKEGEFEFALLDGEGNEVAVAKNTADGEFTFEAVEFDEVGTFNYTIVEKDTKVSGVTNNIDNAVYGVQVVVTDEGFDGQLDAKVTYLKDGEEADVIFINKYEAAPTSIQIGAAKVLNGRALEDGEFSFTIKAVTDGAPMPAETTVKNTADGAVLFGEIEYTEAGTYVYEISEEKGSLENVTYDETVYTVTVVVKDDQEGHLVAELSEDSKSIVFTNTYKTPEDPEDPVDPEDPKDPGKTAKTGDEARILTYLFGLLVSLVAAFVALIVRRRNHYRR